MIKSEKSGIVLDVNVWLDAIGPLGELSQWENLSGLETVGVRANAARSVRRLTSAQISGSGSKVRVCASKHILDLLFVKLQSFYGWNRPAAAAAVAQVALFCNATGGSYDVDARSVLSDVNAAVSSLHLTSSEKTDADIDFEDLMVLATATAVKASVLVTNDGGLQQTHATMLRRFDLAVVFPKQFAAAVN
jgi:predicted nucleic acid-binding protein